MSQAFSDAVHAALYARGDKRLLWRKTVAGAIAQRRYFSFSMAGDPGAGTYPGAALAASQIVGGSSPSISGGIITLPDAAAGLKSVLLSANAAGHATSLNGNARFFDLLATYQGFNATTSPGAQNTTGSAGGSNTLPRYSSGRGVAILIEVQTALGAANVTATISYTNQAGASGRTATASLLASAAAGTVFFADLQAGDTGAISVQSVTLSASALAGTFAVCLVRPLFDVFVLSVSSNTHNVGRIDFLDEEGAAILETGAALVFVWEPANSVNAGLSGALRAVDISYP